MRVSAAVLCWALAGSAQALTVDCGRLLDVKSGQWREKVSVVVEQGRITAVTPMPLAVSGERVDLSGYACLPGLMDMHVHLSHETRKQADSFREQLQLNPSDYALRMPTYAARTLLAGFTTVRDLGAADNLNVSLKRATEQGWVRGPRVFSSGKSIATTGGHADPTNSLRKELLDALGDPGPLEGVVNNVEEARQAVRQRYKDGADLIKITATGGVLSQAASGQNPQFTEEEIKAIVDTGKDYGFPVAAHAHGAEGMKRAIRAGVVSIEHGTYMDDEAIKLFRKHGTWYVPTISAGRFVAQQSRIEDYYSPLVRPKAAAIGPLIQATFAKAHKSSVRIAFGTDAGVFPHGENAKEFAYMVEGGMTPLEAIRAATVHAAQLLGAAGELGAVEIGYAADLIAVDGDPLKDVTLLQNVRFVMKEGAIYKKP